MESEVKAGRYFGIEKNKEKTFTVFIDRYIENEVMDTPRISEAKKMLIC
jgi:hypothetical protein